jgi:chitinase
MARSIHLAAAGCAAALALMAAPAAVDAFPAPPSAGESIPAPPSAGESILAHLHSRGEALHISTPSPVRSLYVDWRDVNWNAPNSTIVGAVDAGWNVVILAFWLSSTGAADMAQAWASLDSATRDATVAYAHSKGAVLLVSAGGATDLPYTRMNGTEFGTGAATWAKEFGMDGVDIDAENIAPKFTYPPLSDEELVAWLVDASVAVKTVMGPSAIVSHAPQAPYFGPVNGSSWPGRTGGYTSVYLQAAAKGDAITFFNTQFYNQGGCYLNYSTLFEQSAPTRARAGAADPCYFPGTAVAEIASYGVPLSILVVGKPLLAGDAGSGYVDPASLHAFFEEARTGPLKWGAGVMSWSWESAEAGPWIQTVWPPQQREEGEGEEGEEDVGGRR